MRFSRKGFSLIEILISSLLTLGVVITAVTWLTKVKGSSSKISARSLSSGEVSTFLEHLTRTLRLATQCVRTTSGSDTAIECDVDVSVPPTGAVQKVRFVRFAANPQYLNYQVWDTSASVWTDQTRYGLENSNVSQFVICDTAMMTANTCAIAPQALSQRMAQLVALEPTRSQKYFRVFVEFDQNGKKVALTTGALLRAGVVNDAPYVWGAR